MSRSWIKYGSFGKYQKEYLSQGFAQQAIALQKLVWAIFALMTKMEQNLMIPYSHLKSHLNQLVKSIFQKQNQKLGRNFDLLSNCKTFLWVNRALDAKYLVLSPLVPSKREKIYKLIQLSLSQFVYFLSIDSSMVTFTKYFLL